MSASGGPERTRISDLYRVKEETLLILPTIPLQRKDFRSRSLRENCGKYSEIARYEGIVREENPRLGRVGSFPTSLELERMSRDSWHARGIQNHFG